MSIDLLRSRAHPVGAGVDLMAVNEVGVAVSYDSCIVLHTVGGFGEPIGNTGPPTQPPTPTPTPSVSPPPRSSLL
jgi:hypothetical protein